MADESTTLILNVADMDRFKEALAEIIKRRDETGPSLVDPEVWARRRGRAEGLDEALRIIAAYLAAPHLTAHLEP
jgi:lipid A disaccharide synthetase